MEILGKPVSRATTVEVVLDDIREKIILNKFPSNKVLSENMLSDMYQVSRGTIRTAFQTLENEGLIHTLDNGRRLPVKVSEKFINDLYAVRVMLEKEACLLIIGNPKLDIAPLASAFSQFYSLYAFSGQELYTQRTLVNTMFHRALINAADNHSLTVCWNTVEPLIKSITKFNYIILGEQQSNEELVEMHKLLLDLIISKDLQILDKIEDHMGTATQETMNGLKQF